MAVLETIDRVAAAHRTTVAAVALAWVRAQPGVTAPIASATNLGQLREILRAVDVKLDAEAVAALEQASR